MPPIVTSADIDRPAAEVFAYATDPSRFSEWQQGVIDGHLDRQTPAVAPGSSAGLGAGYPHVGVVASPPRVTAAAARPGEVPDDVTVRVEQGRRGNLGQVPLTARRPQQVLWPEHRVLGVLLPG